MNRKILNAFVIVSLMFLIWGCSETQRARDVDKAGFLGDYSQLKQGEDEAYRNRKIR